MPYTAAQLTTIYTNIHAGLAPSAAQNEILKAWAAQTNAGTLSDAAALQLVIDTADADSAVAITSYQFFTGTTPSAAGLAYLVNSATNTNDLNDAYYTNFNQTNRYINFAANLGTGAGAGATSFAANYGALSFAQAVDVAYEVVIGSNNAAAAGINVANAKAFIVSQLPYFTALANQNFPTATAAQKDLIIKAEMVGYTISEAIKANVGSYSNATSALLADLGPDNTANLGTDLLAAYSVGTATLTSGVDVLTSNVFNAPRVYNPGGTDQINSLNDDDVLTGAGTNPTLNFTYVNDADTNDYYIVPVLNNIQTVNVAFATDQSATLDMEDSTGQKSVNITRISGNGPSANIVNLTTVPANLSVSNSNAPSSDVQFGFLQSAVAGAADATTLTLSNVNVRNLFVEQTTTGGALTDGVETITLVSTGSANKVGTLEAEDLKSLVITGGQKLTLGTTSNIINGGVGGLLEAVTYGKGLNNVAGSLTSVDASALTASLDITLATEVTATLDDTSGTPVNFSVKGGSGNDTIRLLNGFDSNADTIDGGAGTDTVQVFASVTKGSITNVENLDARAYNGGAIAVDTSLFPQLATITVRNEGNNGAAPAVAPATFTLTKLTPTTAAAITVLHATTGNNGIGGTTVEASLATDTASDTVGVTINNGVNANPRFNFTLTAGTAPAPGGTNPVENVTITDSDTESNSVKLTNVASHTGTITLNGGQVGNFLNLDSTANATNKDQTGGAADGKVWLDVGAGAAERLVATTINAGAFVGDVIVRVGNPAGPAGAQTITMGSGNDVVIFDVISGAVGDTTAGLSISDTVAGGAGSDQLVIDGHGKAISLGASEWTNVTGFETLRLIGNNVADNNALGATNAYNLTLTNAFITANNTTTGGVQRIAIINDNDPTNDANGNASTGGVNTGVTIDARQLDATHSFSYNGAENAGNTADRFIMSDANINGTAIIDGGFKLFNDKAANLDVLEARNAAVVTIGDLSNVKNVGTLQFTNDTATTQSSYLQLDTATIDALVNSSHTASTTEVETLNIGVQGNTNVVGASTNLTIDATSVDFTKTNFTITSVGGTTGINLVGMTGPVTFTGGAGNDSITLGTNVGLAPHQIDLGGGVDTVAFTGTVSSFAVTLGAAGTAAFTTGATTTTHSIKNVENIDLSAVATTGPNSVNGSAANETITGSNQNDVLAGGGGNDVLIGGGGNDTIDGGTGQDTLTGGAGQDTFVFNGNNGVGDNDFITDFTVGAGNDIIFIDSGAVNGGFAAGLTNGTLVSIAASANNSFIVDTSGGPGYASFLLAEAAVNTANAGTTNYALIFFNTTTNAVELWLDDTSAVAGGAVQLASFTNANTDALADVFLVGLTTGNLLAV